MHTSDYSGFPLLRAISSESGQKFDGFSRFWIHGNSYQDDGDSFPFLFINGGARTLSGSTNGSAVIRDTVTQRQIQLLEHNGDPSQSTMIANSLLMPTSGERRAKISRIVRYQSLYLMRVVAHFVFQHLRHTMSQKGSIGSQPQLAVSTPRSKFGRPLITLPPCAPGTTER